MPTSALDNNVLLFVNNKKNFQPFYKLPSINQGNTMTFNYYDGIDIFHITKLKVLQDHWQKICLQRLSIHQGDAFIYVLRTLDNKAYQPSWSDCSNKNDPEKCVVYTWWKKRCPNRKRSSNGEIDACRSRFLYKQGIGDHLYVPESNECAADQHTCDKNAQDGVFKYSLIIQRFFDKN